MGDPCWMSDTQMPKPEPFFRMSLGKPSVDDRRGMSAATHL
ncbi:MAG: hypothetical protein O2898_08120 [Proteobacteria bacterium]|nr:hypothetical protein [Pseudomonadota bacterium]